MYDEILDAWDAYLRPTSSSPLTIKKSPPSTRACMRGTEHVCVFPWALPAQSKVPQVEREVRDAGLGEHRDGWWMLNPCTSCLDCPGADFVGGKILQPSATSQKSYPTPSEILQGIQGGWQCHQRQGAEVDQEGTECLKATRSAGTRRHPGNGE